MISPLQLLLFGCRKVEAIGPEKVLLDNMWAALYSRLVQSPKMLRIRLKMPAKVASKIVALRPCLEALIVRTCIHPEQLGEQPEKVGWSSFEWHESDTIAGQTTGRTRV
jgi:hypothetical protein